MCKGTMKRAPLGETDPWHTSWEKKGESASDDGLHATSVQYGMPLGGDSGIGRKGKVYYQLGWESAPIYTSILQIWSAGPVYEPVS